MKWSRAFAYGLKYLMLSAVFNVLGFIMILSSVSINLDLSGSGLLISIDASKPLASIGSMILLVMGFAILILGNVASFMKVLVDAMKESNKELLW